MYRSLVHRSLGHGSLAGPHTLTAEELGLIVELDLLELLDSCLGAFEVVKGR